MRKLALLIFLVYSAKSFALDFHELQGCFKTIEVDGSTPSRGPVAYRNQSALEDLGNRTYRSTRDNSALDIFVLTIFQGYTDPWYGYNPFVIFKDLGVVTQTEDSLSYRVDEDVYMKSLGKFSKVDHKLELDIKRIAPDTYAASAYYESHQRSARRKTTFTIKTQECFED